jgi:hypothetical protein
MSLERGAALSGGVAFGILGGAIGHTLADNAVRAAQGVGHETALALAHDNYLTTVAEWTAGGALGGALVCALFAFLINRSFKEGSGVME